MHCAWEKLAVLFVSFDCSCAVNEIMGDIWMGIERNEDIIDDENYIMIPNEWEKFWGPGNEQRQTFFVHVLDIPAILMYSGLLCDLYHHAYLSVDADFGWNVWFYLCVCPVHQFC